MGLSDSCLYPLAWCFHKLGVQVFLNICQQKNQEKLWLNWTRQTVCQVPSAKENTEVWCWRSCGPPEQLGRDFIFTRRLLTQMMTSPQSRQSTYNSEPKWTWTSVSGWCRTWPKAVPLPRSCWFCPLLWRLILCGHLARLEHPAIESNPNVDVAVLEQDTVKTGR